MKERLLRISELIPKGKGFADIGTDHGYLPLYMAQNGYNGNIIASDINADPLSCAVVNAREAGLDDKINFFLCDGIHPDCREKVDTIVIAGMGGDAICGILDRAEWCMDPQYTIIMQPMTKAEILRYWLSYNDFEIVDEILLEENGLLYQLICARYGQRTVLSDAEIFAGRLDLIKKQPLFEKHLSSCRKRIYKLLKGLENSDKPEDKLRFDMYTEIYSELLDIS